jgi:hypothetical protein
LESTYLSKKKSWAPLPSWTQVAALNNSRESQSSSVGTSDQGRDSDAQRSQGQRQRSAVPNNFKFRTPKPPHRGG